VKIVVCVKHVPEGRLRLDPGVNRLDRSGPGDLNGVDRYAVEEALRVKDATGAEVVTVSMGPEQATETLRSVLGLGADRAVLASDASAAGSDLVATAKVLAAVLRREEADLVLFGQQTSDGGGALLWAAVAELLRLPYISQVSSLALTGGSLRVGRQTEVGDEVLDLATPALVSVSDSINEPRYASLKGMMAAKKKPLERVTLADLGVAASDVGETGSKTVVLAVGPPAARAAAMKIEDDGHAADQIVEFLAARDLV
jgi:electron transfer flavoprotein beta subunit